MRLTGLEHGHMVAFTLRHLTAGRLEAIRRALTQIHQDGRQQLMLIDGISVTVLDNDLHPGLPQPDPRIPGLGEILVDRLTLARAFNEWMRRFVEEPERFEREFESVGGFLADEESDREPRYGFAAAAYLEMLIGEVRGGNTGAPPDQANGDPG